MKCINCGADIEPNTQFCQNCGTPIAVVVDPAMEILNKSKTHKTVSIVFSSIFIAVFVVIFAVGLSTGLGISYEVNEVAAAVASELFRVLFLFAGITAGFVAIMNVAVLICSIYMDRSRRVCIAIIVLSIFGCNIPSIVCGALGLKRLAAFKAQGNIR